MDTLTMGRLAREAGVNKETIRFYERKGILRAPTTASGRRAYPPEAITRVRFVKRAQQLGFSLAQVLELLVLADGERASCNEVADLTRSHLVEIEEKLRQLRDMQRVLKGLLARCERSGGVASCPILETLSDAGKKKKRRGE